ncbi:hypothetical protein ARMGADRAFT_1039296 [Armillaria gallica]|uniref:Uncharacterized protein n=1 Tax=Armillaria gallica TaxID=47427 RepID=A0A2H3D1W8_ARMGA|nr:hypothetical protein ARMGADRAFT_1039296 [Armillaria gallica]
MAKSSPPDSHIHPSLRFLTASQPMPMDDSGEDEDLPPAGEVRRSDKMAAVHAVATAGPMFVTDLTSFSQYIKANIELSTESMLKLDAFCSPHALEKCIAIMYATTLSNQDMLRAMRKTVNKTWEISGELKNKIWSYVRVFLLSPNLSCYRGNIMESALHAMHELQVQGLPPDTELARITQVLSLICKQLTTFRTVIKEKVMVSQTPNGAPIKNIGDLAGALIKNTELPCTQDLYMRLVFLRFLMSPESGINLDNDEQFWLSVDDTLKTYRSSGEAQMMQSLNSCYQADKQKYGELLGDGHQTMSLDNVALWIKVVNKNAQSVVKARNEILAIFSNGVILGQGDPD